MPTTDPSKSSSASAPEDLGHTGDDVMDAVRVGVGTLTAPWTLEQLGAAVGADPPSLAPYVERLLEGGTIVRLGPDPRADEPEPMLYGPPPVDNSPH